MRKLSFVLIGLILFIFVSCTNKINKASISIPKKINLNIPTLKVTANNEDISVEKGGYSWQKDGNAVSVDSAGPEEIAKNMDGDKIKPQSMISLEFSEEPNKVNVIDWSNLKNNSYTFNKDRIIVPQEEGTYIYEIFSEWEEGEISFTIKVIVSEE